MSSSDRRRQLKKSSPATGAGAVIVTVAIFLGIAVVSSVVPALRKHGEMIAERVAPMKQLPKPPPKKGPAHKDVKKAAVKQKSSQKKASADKSTPKTMVTPPSGDSQGDQSGFTQAPGAGKAGVVPGTGTGNGTGNGAGNGAGNGPGGPKPPPTDTKPKVTPTPSKPVPTKPKPTPPERPSGPTMGAVAEYQFKPSIPDDLRDAALQTEAKLLVHIDPDGNSTAQLMSSSGNPDLDKIAIDAIKKWRWKPALDLGRPVASDIVVRFQFEVS